MIKNNWKSIYLGIILALVLVVLVTMLFTSPVSADQAPAEIIFPAEGENLYIGQVVQWEVFCHEGWICTPNITPNGGFDEDDFHFLNTSEAKNFRFHLVAQKFIDGEWVRITVEPHNYTILPGPVRVFGVFPGAERFTGVRYEWRIEVGEGWTAVAEQVPGGLDGIYLNVSLPGEAVFRTTATEQSSGVVLVQDIHFTVVFSPGEVRIGSVGEGTMGALRGGIPTDPAPGGPGPDGDIGTGGVDPGRPAPGARPATTEFLPGVVYNEGVEWIRCELVAPALVLDGYSFDAVVRAVGRVAAECAWPEGGE